MILKEKSGFVKRNLIKLMNLFMENKFTSLFICIGVSIILCQPYQNTKNRIPITAEERKEWIEKHLPKTQKEKLDSLVELNKNKSKEE